eukprot:ANDGO_01667.mRNA.1 hypothetical protein
MSDQSGETDSEDDLDFVPQHASDGDEKDESSKRVVKQQKELQKRQKEPGQRTTDAGGWVAKKPRIASANRSNRRFLEDLDSDSNDQFPASSMPQNQQQQHQQQEQASTNKDEDEDDAAVVVSETAKEKANAMWAALQSGKHVMSKSGKTSGNSTSHSSSSSSSSSDNGNCAENGLKSMQGMPMTQSSLGVKPQPQLQSQPPPRASSSIEALMAKVIDRKKTGSSTNTLEKTRAEWSLLKKESGAEDEIRERSATGYLDRKEFLQRSDLREFQNEMAAKSSRK